MVDENDNNDVDTIEEGRTVNIWEQQGYSPLLSAEGGGTMAMVTMGPDANFGFPDESDEDDDNYGDFDHGKDVGDEHVKQLRLKDLESTFAVSHETDQSLETDFRMLAEQALQQLELEYAQTVGKPSAPGALGALDACQPFNSREPRQLESTIETEEDAVCSSSISQQQQQQDGPTTGFAKWSEWNVNEYHSTEETAAEPSVEQEDLMSVKIIPVIDGDAVRRAVSNIRKVQATGFISKYKEWESMANKASFDKSDSKDGGSKTAHEGGIWAASFIVPQSHSCIPKSILRLYSLSASNAEVTSKSSSHMPSREDETQQLSRSATLVEALCRIDALKRQDCLVVHLIGCDDKEEDLTITKGASSGIIPSFLQPALQWLPRARQVPKNIEFHLVGPNLQTDANYEVVESLPATFESVKVQYHQQLYHDFLQQQQQQSNDVVRSEPSLAAPDLILCFNAGIWGYDDWKPTLQYLLERSRALRDEANNASRKKIPFVVSAYTLWEAQEDFEVLKNSFGSDDSSSADCMWKPQLNPFGSHKERPTTTAPPEQTETYRENAAWQAWRI